MIEITERDKEVFKYINRFGFIKKKYLFERFKGQKTSDTQGIRKRLKKLENEKYLYSFGQTYGLAIKGKELLSNLGVEIHYEKTDEKVKRNLAEAHEILYRFGDEEIKSRIEILESGQLKNKDSNRAKLFLGEMTIENGFQYVVYKIKKNSPVSYIKKVISDIRNYGFTNVIIAVENKYHMIKLKEFNIYSAGLKSCIIVPFSDEGIEKIKVLQKGYFGDEYMMKVIEKLNPEVRGKEIYVNGIRTFNMLRFDAVEENVMLAEVAKDRLETYNIITFKDNADYFNSVYRNAHIATLSFSKFKEKICNI